jgi:hypothetical protein
VDGRHTADAESAFDPVPARDRGGAGHPPEVLVAPPTAAPPPAVVLLEVPVPPPLVAVVGGVVVVVGGVVVVAEDVVGGWVTVVEAWVGVVGTVTVGVDVDCVVQSLTASSWTVLAPWPRFVTSFWLTPDGRSVIRLVKLRDAAVALPQWPACTASEIDVSCAAIELLCPDESRPLPLEPQATTKAAANPRTAASSAREPNPIGG